MSEEKINEYDEKIKEISQTFPSEKRKVIIDKDKLSLKECVLMIMGDGAEKEAMIEKVKKENVTNVVFIDSVPKEQVPDYVALQDLALVNLRRDPLFTTVIPSKIFETSAMHIPIMLGVDGEARKLVEQYGAGLYYEPENKADFLFAKHSA